MTQPADPMPSPYSPDFQRLIASVNNTYDAVQKILNAWATTSLPVTSPSSDPDAYVQPILTLTEILRKQRLADVQSRLYEATLELIDQHCRATGTRLHKGAVYANFAIAHFERGLYSRGIAYLHAAAEEDKTTYGITDISQSYALSSSGIFGQWLNIVLGNMMPPGVLPFLAGVLTGNYGPSHVKELCRSLAGLADLRLPACLIEYSAARGMADPHSASVRLECLRDLAALFEVMWKRIGSRHKDPMVVAAFSDPPTLAGLICHMHFAGARAARRKKPSLAANKAQGLLWNSIYQDADLLAAIDDHIDFFGDASHSIADVWRYLSTTQLSPNAAAHEVATRFLLAYRIRNETAHTFNPLDPGITANVDQLFERLLEANLYLWFWARETGQVAL